MVERWEPGQQIVRREVLGLAPGFHPVPEPPWYRRPWAAIPVFVVRDADEELVTYLPARAEIGLVDGEWPTPNGRHPWYPKPRWEGHGCLMVQRPGDPYAVWHFWTGPERTFACWYINLQADFVRTGIGYDTQDFELDLVVTPDGTCTVKDLDVLEERVTQGRFTSELADWIREVGRDLDSQLRSGRTLWDPAWSQWTPPETWTDARLPAGWEVG